MIQTAPGSTYVSVPAPLEERAESLRLHAIVQAQQAIAEAGLDVDEVMRIIAEQMMLVTPATGAVVELAEGEEMVYRAACGSAAGSLGLRIKRATSLSGRCVQTGEVLVCLDSETDERVDREACRRVGARSMVVVPLKRRGTNVGVLKVLSTQIAAFDAVDIDTLRLLAGLTGSVLGQAAEFHAGQLLLAERTEALDSLRVSEERFRGSFEAASIGKALVGLDGQWLKVNSAVSEMLGYTESELYALSFQDITHPDDLDADLAYVQQLLDGAMDRYQMEKRYLHKAGHVIHALLSVSIVRDRYGKPVHFVSQIQDITAQKQAKEALERANDELERRVAHRTAELENANRALIIAKEEAERASLAKSEFLSRSSHELRTPLNAILGFAQMLEMAGLSERDHKRAQHILTGGRHLLKIIDELLDIARIEAGKQLLRIESVSLFETVQEVLQLIRPDADRMQVTLDIRPGKDTDIYVRADHQRLKQVLLNLLSNAIKYNRPDGEAVIHWEITRDGRARITVQDTGTGFTAEQLQQLFTPFNRLGAERAGIPGTGLGLTLTKSLVQAMGDTLCVDTVPGQGSSFSFALDIAD